MTHAQVHISQRPLRTPRAAAIAGILFAVLQIASYALLQYSIPVDIMDQSDWLAEIAGNITLGIGLLPFAGIAFLWFIGVLRDRLGHLEDQFFSTLFFGSGLLYLAMTFASAAMAGGILAVYANDPDLLLDSSIYIFSRAIIYKFNNVYAIRMAGMFMIALGTIWVRTGLMPRWLVLLTFLTALTLLIGISFYPWITLLFPIWVLVISTFILVLNYRFQKKDGLTLDG